ncbi:efflux RND transporter periplasmic adaptor subunit [Thermaurantiacus tibetensis]|uniref:efflux RND transporter periplasmic adaptor subunit n=1 Tax=Thermaurantiacus tibetensis TaxID=2759035 RepID=UPI00188E11E6|nr:efflux RND transporter periplasmic adaptor subunit [Thermaurantiacus tibetensis]
MNMHLPSQQMDGLTPDGLARVESAAARPFVARAPWKRVGIALLVVAALAGFVWYLVERAQAPGPTAPPSGPPAVSVMVPGQVEVAERIRVTGTIAPRRELPVGVVGEGGAIVAIRAEAGQYVRAGQVLAEIDSGVQRAQLAQLEAAVAQAEADVRLAQSELDRALKLVERGFVSQADIDRRTATRDAARARAEVARAQVREMRERLARLVIRAPEAGLVLDRMVEPGQVVSPASGALFRIAAGGQMELRAEVAEQDMPALAVGEPVMVTPAGAAQSVTGTVWLVEPLIDPQRRLGTARIALPSDPSIRAGGFAVAEIETRRALRPVLPQSAVLADQSGSYVYVVDADDRVVRRDVRIARISEAGVAIAEGLSGTEKVVVSAGAFIRPGEKVTPVLRRA